MKALVLIHEAFAPTGGIAKFNADLLQALCAYGPVSEVVVLPRHPPHVPMHLPSNL